MKMDEDIWSRLAKNLPELDSLDGDPSPKMEKIEDAPQEGAKDSVILYKLTTEVYVYQHIGSDVWYGANTLQDVTILGEMSLDQAKSIVRAKKIRRKSS